MKKIKMTANKRPSNDIVFGLVFEDREIFKIMIKCILGEDLDDSSYVVTQKENLMGSSIYNKIRFDVYAEGAKIYTVDMQNGYPKKIIRYRLVYYACRSIGGQRVRKGEYDKLKTCVISFIFENSSYENKNFITEYYIASDDNGKIKKYTDLLTIVELNLKHYKETDDANMNILCEFLKIKNNKNLEKFRENHGGSAFGGMLYEKYIEVVSDESKLEEVAKMQLYQEKMQLRYHTADEANVIWNKAEKKSAKEIALKMLKRGTPLDYIAEDTGLTKKQIESISKKIQPSRA